MTDHIPTDRAGRIAHVAKIAIGRDPHDPNQPIAGWQSKLSIAMGLSRGAVHGTLKSPSSQVFDRKLLRFAIDTRDRLDRDRSDLELYFKTLRDEQEASALEGYDN